MATRLGEYKHLHGSRIGGAIDGNVDDDEDNVDNDEEKGEDSANELLDEEMQDEPSDVGSIATLLGRVAGVKDFTNDHVFSFLSTDIPKVFIILNQEPLGVGHGLQLPLLS